MLQTAAAPPVSGQARRGEITPSFEQLKALVAQGVGETTTVPVYREILADLETPVSAFIKIRGTGPSFLLESIEGGVRLARYSFIGANPLSVLRLVDGEAVVEDTSGVERTPYSDPLAALADLLAPYQALEVPGLQLPRFVGGAVGYLSYEAVR
jgi:anthranilate synthase component 1